MSMDYEGAGKRLKIYIGEQDHYHGKPLYEAIIYRMRSEKIGGATVLKGIEGYGAGSHGVHSAHLLDMSTDLPIIVEIVGKEDEIKKAADIIKQMTGDAHCRLLMTLETIEIIHHTY